MTDNPPVTVDEAQLWRIRAELTNELDVQQRQRRNNFVVCHCRSTRLLGCVTAAAWLGRGRISSAVHDVMFLGAFMLSLIWLIWFLCDASSVKAECAKTAFKLQALDAEAVQTTRAFELAQSGFAFVLFLRSFGSEAAGVGRASMDLVESTRGLAHFRRGFSSLDMSVLLAHKKWLAQLDVLRSIQQRYPTVLLGNTALGSDMREELTQSGIIEVTIQAQEWWPIFLALSHRAYMIILYLMETASSMLAREELSFSPTLRQAWSLYIEAASPMLLREMQHIGTHGLRYAIFADDAELRRLAEEPSLGESFLSSAVVRLNLGNVADLWALKGI